MSTDAAVDSFCSNIDAMGLTHAERMLAARLPQDLLKAICVACQVDGIIELDRQWKVVGATLYLALASYQEAANR